MKCCKTCVHLNVPLSPSGRRIVYSDKAYRCTVEVLPQTLPDCMTVVRGYRPEPHRMSMTGDMGTTCPFWAPLP